MPEAKKLDLYKSLADQYLARKAPLLLTIRPARYLAIDGSGQPGGEVFTTRLGALYNVAFTIKMASKFAGRDYAVCKLEGLWWHEGEKGQVSELPSENSDWTLLIRTPDFIKASDRNKAVEALLKKGKATDVADVRLEEIEEGLCVQMLHVGPYSEEPSSISRMREFARSQGLEFHGKHHEIYLSDPRRVAPEKLRTILRQPVR